MSNRGQQIGELLNKSSASGPDVTSALKAIGGSGEKKMIDGAKNLYDYALKEGDKSGTIKGTVATLGVCGTIYLATKGIGYVKKKIAAKKAHDEMGEKIYAAFNEHLVDSGDNGGVSDEETESSET